MNDSAIGNVIPLSKKRKGPNKFVVQVKQQEVRIVIEKNIRKINAAIRNRMTISQVRGKK